MQLEVKAYRGIDRASIEIEEGKITALFGENANGKSSLIEPLQYICLADGNLLGLSKKDIKDVIHNGCEKSEMSLATLKGRRSISLPACEVKTHEGTGLNASAHALGMVRIAELGPDALANLLQAKLDVKLGRDRLAQEFDEITIGDTTKLKPELKQVFLDTVFGTDKISAKGWDTGEKCAKENSLALQRQFSSEAGVKWGTKQGLTFTPKGWELDLGTAKLEDLTAAITKKREELERTIASNAVSEAEIENLKVEAEKLGPRHTELAAAHGKFVGTNAALEAASYAYDLVRAFANSVTCAGCGMVGHVKGNTLAKIETEKAPAKGDVARAQEALTTANDAQGAAALDLEKAKRAVEASERAAAGLAKLDAAETGDKSLVDAARSLLANAEIRLNAFTIKAKCTELHMQITVVQQAAELMGPDGLRRRVLIAALESFNKHLDNLCEKAGWSRIEIDSDLVVRYGVVPYVTLSGGEKYRVNATIQVAIAEQERAPLVVFDEAQILDRPGRNGFFSMLIKTGITAVVGMTIAPTTKGGDIRESVPRLKPNQGASYWVAKGIVEKLELAMALV